MKIKEVARTLKVVFPGGYNGHFDVGLPRPYDGFEYLKEDFMPGQFHFHAPSEHAVDGKHHDLEMHIVKSDYNVNHSVIGIFFDVGEESSFLKSLRMTTATKEGTYIDPVPFHDFI